MFTSQTGTGSIEVTLNGWKSPAYVTAILPPALAATAISTAVAGTLSSNVLRDFQNVKDYGAKCDGVTDDTAAFSSGYSSVKALRIPPNSTCVVSTIVIPDGGALSGDDIATSIILQKANSTLPAVTYNSSSQNVLVQNLTVNGNSANQTNILAGIYVNNTGNPPQSGTNYAGSATHIFNTYVVNASGDCYSFLYGGGTNVYDTLKAFQCGGHGINWNLVDSHFSNFDLGGTGGDGLHIGTGGYSTTFDTGKIWFTAGSGVYLAGYRDNLNGLVIENTQSHGVYLYSAAQNIIAGTSINQAGTEAPNPNNPNASGIALYDSRNNIITASVVDIQGSPVMAYALRTISGGSGVSNNLLTINGVGYTSGLILWGDQLNDPLRNQLNTNNPNNNDGQLFWTYLNAPFNGASVSTYSITNPAAPTIAPAGTTGVTSYSYQVVGRADSINVTAPSSSGSTTTGNATLSATNYNTVSWSSVTNANCYDIYRMAGGSTQGQIAYCTKGTSFNDTGYAASGTAPSGNTTGIVSASNYVFVGTQTYYQPTKINSYASGGFTIQSSATNGSINLTPNGSGGVILNGQSNMPNYKATTGTRYLCIDTNGNIASSATPCTGT